MENDFGLDIFISIIPPFIISSRVATEISQNHPRPMWTGSPNRKCIFTLLLLTENHGIIF